jgi:hypothetical protein
MRFHPLCPIRAGALSPAPGNPPATPYFAHGPLRLTVEPGIVRSGYDFGGPMTEDDAVKDSAGWIKPVRALAGTVFVYPRNAAGPSAAAVRAGLRVTSEGFESPLVRVSGRIAIGRGYAGGMARALDLDGDGTPELTFSDETGFIARHRQGRITALETDRAVTARYRDRGFQLRPHEPLTIDTAP